MAVKTSYEPKDARITFDEKYYSDDVDQSKREPRKRITGTQALVEFLNTTSPEEFQKKRSSASFFGRKKSTTTADKSKPFRKSYIEIIANPFNRSKKSNAILLGAQLNQTLSKTTSIYSEQPVLPIPHQQQQRKSPPILISQSQQTYGKRQPPSLCVGSLQDTPTQSKTLFTLPGHDELIEGGLKQRLKNYQSHALEKPSDMISKSLALEHLAALEVVSTMKKMEQQHIEPKKKCRHIQVQTMPFYPDDNKEPLLLLNVEAESVVKKNPIDSEVDLKQRLAKAEHELKQEKLTSSRLQAALEETRDQLEVLSGLAYKKLREVWEEKTRWETACIETKEKCWHDHQQFIMAKHNNSSSNTTITSSNSSSGDSDNDLSIVDGTMMDFLEEEDFSS
ncbi:uncharacterized protein EV154DRAFT_506414 [Mucor mucedo]|uniref:uncharacterized protein n=1 Tax=Mucor mucedo TaxID=29922 RepID=UPI002220A038|nr:uncharacterized protein EV154DRAFT_506414 [Mucor mucedo]KAI7891939.1 hypothetical protein EV154DRAFT_506414 [Mucor mucedo]